MRSELHFPSSLSAIMSLQSVLSYTAMLCMFQVERIEVDSYQESYLFGLLPPKQKPRMLWPRWALGMDHFARSYTSPPPPPMFWAQEFAPNERKGVCSGKPATWPGPGQDVSRADKRIVSDGPSVDGGLSLQEPTDDLIMAIGGEKCSPRLLDVGTGVSFQGPGTIVQHGHMDMMEQAESDQRDVTVPRSCCCSWLWCCCCCKGNSKTQN